MSKGGKTGYYVPSDGVTPELLAQIKSIGPGNIVETTPDSRQSILTEAQHLVYGPRQATYGHPFDDFSRIGRVWAAVLGLPEVTPEQVALCMVGLKLSRLVGEPGHRDSIVDIAGYAGTYELVRERR